MFKLKSAPNSPSLTRYTLLALTALTLSGCANGENPFKDFKFPNFNLTSNASQKTGAEKRALVNAATAECPRVSALPELARVTQFADETNPVPTMILSETVLHKLDSSCITSESAINLDIVLNFISTLGTAGLKQNTTESSYSHAYFVAVVEPSGKIIAKDVFALSPVFTSGQKEVYSTQRLQQTIPLSSNIPANQYQIMVGFQLSESELAYNRTMKPRAVTALPATPAVSNADSSDDISIKPIPTTRPRAGVNN